MTFAILSRIIGKETQQMIQIAEDIVVRCWQGEKAAFRGMVQTYQRMVFSLSLKLLCDEEEARDMVQETFIRVWQRMGEYDTRKNFTTWIYTIATHLCLDRLKRMKQVVTMPDDELVFRRYASDTDMHRMLENKEWVSIVRMLAEGLGEKQRMVFTLCHLEGLTSSEVEEITGLDAKQVKSNLYVARQTIRARLKQLGYDTNR